MIVVAFVIVFLFLWFAFPAFRCFVQHPLATLVNVVPDVFRYYFHRCFDLCPTGALDIYCGYFGYGKTLSAVHRVVGLYRRYNGKKVWNPSLHKFVLQRIQILSNVTLSVPFVPLENLSQVVAAAQKSTSSYDAEHDTLTVTLVLMDELSVQMNSRSFKDNFNAYFLNTLLCCRHYHISFFGTSQRFAHCDKLLRDVTHSVIQCKKIWRFQTLFVYDAWELEHAGDSELIKPKAITAWFVRDKDYAAYDTLAVVGNLQKKFEDKDILTEAEILANQSPSGPGDTDSITNPSRKLKRIRRKSA